MILERMTVEDYEKLKIPLQTTFMVFGPSLNRYYQEKGSVANSKVSIADLKNTYGNCYSSQLQILKIIKNRR